MNRVFNFGGAQFVLLEKKVLRGMQYYHVLQNTFTGERIFLYCLPEA